jgi:hypothetical protein
MSEIGTLRKKKTRTTRKKKYSASARLDRSLRLNSGKNALATIDGNIHDNRTRLYGTVYRATLLELASTEIRTMSIRA